MTYSLIASGSLGEAVESRVARTVLDAWARVHEATEMEHVRHRRGRRGLAQLQGLGQSWLYCWDAPSGSPIVRADVQELATRISEDSTDFHIRGLSADGRWMLEAERGQDRTVVTMWDLNGLVDWPEGSLPPAG